MTPRDVLWKWIAPVYKPRLDPGRAERVLAEFDHRQGFAAYHDWCRGIFSRGPSATAAGVLRQRGFAHLRVLSAERARQLLLQMQERCPIAAVNKGRHRVDGFRIDADGLRDQILSEVLTDPVDRHLVDHFGSEYLVLWMAVTATPAVADPTVSFRWHCDRGPRAHLKLMIYLNGSDEHGGNTEFLSLADTAAVAARGYVFGRVRARTADLSELSSLAGRPLRACRRPLAAGDAVLFRPASVLHRGIAPTRGTRHAVTLCLLPSPVPWQRALAQGTLADLAVDDKWPRHASELAQALMAASQP